ncbi:MAG: Mg2+/Co2+ transporter [Deltaproteobacteria bacterium HGW-Deltaproteobacteria-13]|nr:MAG: Mg2+/Co2+ transporter [Deltaproteobacteria bacterium HGW-Deltaproteobacteria-13]
MSESRFYHITKEGKLVGLATLAEAMAETKKGGFIWLDYTKPTKEELSLLIEPFGLHPLSIEDCLDENLIPKIDDYPRYTFLLFNAFHYAGEVLSIDEADMFLGSDFLITVNVVGAENQQLLKSIERIVEINHKNVLQGPAFLLHVILDYIVDQKYVAIEAYENDLDKAEETIISDLSGFNPATLLNLRRNLFALRRSLFHEREILAKIYRKDCPFIPEKALFFYRDIYDHLTKFFELTETSRDTVTSLMEMYLSMLNNRMAETANKTNRTVRRLTFITTIFMPLTLLAGIGGMSEWSMMTGPQNWKIAYPLFLIAMVIIGIINYYLLKRLEKKGGGQDQT